LKDLLDDPSTQGLVGGGGLGPPPLILSHRARRADDAFGDLTELCLGVIQAEYQPPRTDPAQGDARLA